MWDAIDLKWTVARTELDCRTLSWHCENSLGMGGTHTFGDQNGCYYFCETKGERHRKENHRFSQYGIRYLIPQVSL